MRISLLALLLLTPALCAQDWQALFNGKDLTGWAMDGYKDYKDAADGDKVKPLWTVEKGLIHTTGKAEGFLRYDGRKFKDFTLRVEYRMGKDHREVNTGIGIRTVPWDVSTAKSKHETRPSNFAYEVQLLDDSEKAPSDHTTGSLYRYVAPKAKNHRPAPEWNAVEVECKGPNIRIEMNGVEVLKCDQTAVPKIKDKPLEGYICVQSHSGTIEFRSIQIKEWK